MNSIPPFSQNRGDFKYIKFEILQIASPSEDVIFSNVRGLYLRKYGNLKVEDIIHDLNYDENNFLKPIHCGYQKVEYLGYIILSRTLLKVALYIIKYVSKSP